MCSAGEIDVRSSVPAAPATATLRQMRSIAGRVVQISVVSLGVVDAATGKTVHFHLEPYFDEVYAGDSKTNQRFTGPRRAERLEIR
jgi:hypothetical protein